MPEFTSPFMASAQQSPESTLGDREIVRALRFQMAAELEAVNQYDEIILATSNPVVREVIRSIQLEEKKHLGELMSLIYYLSPIDKSLVADGEDETSNILMGRMLVESTASGS